MTQTPLTRCLHSLILFLACCATAHATIVRMEIAFGDDPNTEDIYIELFDTTIEDPDPDCIDGTVPSP